jgi:hypothetical protein
VSWYDEGVRFLVALLAVSAILIVAACNSDDSSSSSGQTALPPSNCTAPCTVGTQCYGPMESSCNGTWYCWSDMQWYCSPQDGGGPGGLPPDASVEDDGPTESGMPVEASPSEASTDAAGSG